MPRNKKIKKNAAFGDQKCFLNSGFQFICIILPYYIDTCELQNFLFQFQQRNGAKYSESEI
jgi:hypothetical protein